MNRGRPKPPSSTMSPATIGTFIVAVVASCSPLIRHRSASIHYSSVSPDPSHWTSPACLRRYRTRREPVSDPITNSWTARVPRPCYDVFKLQQACARARVNYRWTHCFSTILAYRFTEASYDRLSNHLREVAHVTFHSRFRRSRDRKFAVAGDWRPRSQTHCASRMRYVERLSLIASLFTSLSIRRTRFRNHIFRINRLGQEASIDWSITRNGRAQRACESRAPRERSCWTVAHSRSAAARAHSRVRAKVLQVYTHAYVYTRIRARAGCKSLGMITDGWRPSVIARGPFIARWCSLKILRFDLVIFGESLKQQKQQKPLASLRYSVPWDYLLSRTTSLRTLCFPRCTQLAVLTMLFISCLIIRRRWCLYTYIPWSCKNETHLLSSVVQLDPTCASAW